MEAWKPSGEVEGLFKRRTDEPPEVPVPTAATPYTPPEPESPEQQMVKQEEWPGARRRSFLIATLIFPTLWAFALSVGKGFLDTQFGPNITKFALPGLGLVPLLVFVYFGINRLANLGMSRWWFLGNFVPILGFWVGFRSFACPAGYAYHKKLDGPGIFLAIIYWLFVLAFLLAIAAVIAVLFGSLGTPETARQIREILRTAIPPTP